MIAGVVALGLGIGVPIVTSAWLVAVTADPVFVIFPLPFIGAAWLIQGLAPSGYRFEDRGVRIERRWLSRRLPYTAIRDVDRVARPIGGLFALGLNGLFGAWGLRWNPSTGLHYLAIANTTDLVYLHTARWLLVLSPERPDEFVAELRRRLSPGSGLVTGVDPDRNGHRRS